MKRSRVLSVILALIGAALVSGCASNRVVKVKPQPPAAKLETIPEQPWPDRKWVSGYWDWRGKYVWVAGRWVEPPRPDAQWTPGYWKRQTPRGWIWVRGHWQ